MSKTRHYHITNLKRIRDELYNNLPKHEQRRIDDERQARIEHYAWREAMKEAKIQPSLWR